MLYILSTNQVLVSVIRQVAEHRSMMVTVHETPRLAFRHLVPSSLLIIDLTRKRLAVAPPPSIPTNVVVGLILQLHQLVSVSWARFLGDHEVSILRLRPGPDRLLDVRRWLARVTCKIPPNQIIDALIHNHPELARCHGLIGALLKNPWGVRHGSDLVSEVGCSAESVKILTKTLGLNRIEHLMTVLRFLTFEHLVMECRMTIKEARRFVGIRDVSNFRRQLRRSAWAASHGRSAITCFDKQRSAS